MRVSVFATPNKQTNKQTVNDACVVNASCFMMLWLWLRLYLTFQSCEMWGPKVGFYFKFQNLENVQKKILIEWKKSDSLNKMLLVNCNF